MRTLKELSNMHCLSAEIFQIEAKIFEAIKDNKKSVQVGIVERNTPFKTKNQEAEMELQDSGYSLFYEKVPFGNWCWEYDKKTYEAYYIYVNLCN
jgi:hypothetical protein